MNIEYITDFYLEVQTFDFQGFESDNFLSEYSSKLTIIRERALSAIITLSPQQVQYNANRLYMLNEYYNEFNDSFQSHIKNNREGKLSIIDFIDWLKQRSLGYFTYEELRLQLEKEPKKTIVKFWDFYGGKRFAVLWLATTLFSITGINGKLHGENFASLKNLEEPEEALSNRNLLCFLSEQQIQSLHRHLITDGFLLSVTSFNEFEDVMTGWDNILNPIQWISSNRALAYLFRQLYSSKLINNSKWQSVLQKRSAFINSKRKLIMAQDLSQAISDYETKGNPKEALRIDEIIDQVKALKKD